MNYEEMKIQAEKQEKSVRLWASVLFSMIIVGLGVGVAAFVRGILK